MKKFQVKLDLQNKSVTEKFAFGRHIVTSMTANPLFTTPNPALSVITGVSDDLETAWDARLVGGKLNTALLHTAESNFDLKVTAIGDWVNGVAQGSETTIKSAGMDTRAIPTPSGVPAQVVNLLIVLAGVSGSLKLRWKRVKGAKVYFVFMCADTDDETKYALIGTPTAAKFIVDDLTPGTIYWFKVKAVGAGGTGDFSDPGKMMVV